METTISHVEKSLVLNPGGTVSIDIKSPNYTVLTPTDKTLGRAMTATANERSLLISQGLSADGARYTNADESFVFWEKGTPLSLKRGTGRRLRIA